MNDLFVVACGAGVHDGLSPCSLMTCAVFITIGRCLNSRPVPIGWLRIIFVLVYAISILVFNFGPAQVLILQKKYIFTAKILYFFLGLWSFVLGILYFKDWFKLNRGLPAENKTNPGFKLMFPGGVLVCLGTVILGVALSALATIWPVDQYILLLGTIGILKGQWMAVMPLLIVYIFISMWPLWLAWVFLSIKNLRPSMIKIVCSSIFFTASSCMILIFK